MAQYEVHAYSDCQVPTCGKILEQRTWPTWQTPTWVHLDGRRECHPSTTATPGEVVANVH